MFLTKTMQARTHLGKVVEFGGNVSNCRMDSKKKQVQNTTGGKLVVDNSIVQHVGETSAIGVCCGSYGIREARQECAFE